MPKNLGRIADVTEILERIWSVNATVEPHWGRMNAGQMVCHLSDAYRLVLREKRVVSKESFLGRTLIRWVALHTNTAWRKNYPTTPEMEQIGGGGTPPSLFARDRETLAKIVEQFSLLPETYAFPRHPYFGALTREEWMIWGYRHADHHLRQFGR